MSENKVELLLANVPVVASKVDLDYPAMLTMVETWLAEKAITLTDEAQIPEAKVVRADINKMVTALQAHDLRVVKELSAGLDAHKEGMKPIYNKLNAAQFRIGEDINAFVEEERKSKDLLVTATITRVCEAAGVPSSIISPDKSWRTKSCSESRMVAEIQEQIAQFRQLEEQKNAIAKAREERSSAIEERVKQFNAEKGSNFAASAYIFNPRFGNTNTSYLQAMNALESQLGADWIIEQGKREKAEQMVAPVPEPVKTAPVEQPMSGPATQSLAAKALAIRKMVIVIEYDPAMAEKAAAAYRAFKAAMDVMGIKISAKRV